MKVDLSKIKINEGGQVEIKIEDLEDFWTLANIIREGDKIRSQIRRKVSKVSAIGKADQKQILTFAIVRITEIDYQAGVPEMNLRGTLCHDVGETKEGSFQRILLDSSRPFTLMKSCWDKFTYDELKEASDPTSNANIVAVIMKSGTANICVVGRNTTVVIQKVSKSIPKIRVHGGSDKSATSKTKFFALTADALLKTPNMSEMKCIIVASPGFLQHEFLSYLKTNQIVLGLQTAFQADKFIQANISNGEPSELEQVLLKPEIQSRVSDLRAVQQAKAYDELMVTMASDQNMVMFGDDAIEKAGNDGAIKALLVTDTYIRGLALKRRLNFLSLKDRLIEMGTDVIVFSTRHVSGTQLNDIGGIIAQLKYPIERHEEGFDDAFDD